MNISFTIKSKTYTILVKAVEKSEEVTVYYFLQPFEIIDIVEIFDSLTVKPSYNTYGTLNVLDSLDTYKVSNVEFVR